MATVTSDDERFKVIVDYQDRCALWPVDLAAPATWRDLGVAGSESELRLFIEQLLASSARMREWFDRGTCRP